MVAKPEQTVAEDTSILSPEQGRAMFEYHVRRRLGISAEKFLRRWDAGEYRDLRDTTEASKVIHLALLIPFARQDP